MHVLARNGCQNIVPAKIIERDIIDVVPVQCKCRSFPFFIALKNKSIINYAFYTKSSKTNILISQFQNGHFLSAPASWFFGLKTCLYCCHGLMVDRFVALLWNIPYMEKCRVLCFFNR